MVVTMRRLAVALVSLALLSFLGLATACGAPDPPAGTGGVSLPMAPCGRGLVVVNSDYQSTNVSLTNLQGTTVSSSFISSASAEAGLSAPLSGDVVVPTAAALGDELLLLDTYPASVLTWVMLETAAVRAQLDVGTGFAANPRDYLPLGDGRAYVSRYETNPAPGQEPYDQGGDVLVIDPQSPAIVGRIDLEAAMADAPGFLPRAGRMLRLDQRVFVLLAGYAADFVEEAPSRVVTLDIATDTILGVTVLDGLYGCSAMAMSASVDEQGEPLAQPRLAVACSGKFGGDSTATLPESGLVLLSTDTTIPVEIARWPAASLAGQPLGFSLDFASSDLVLVTVQGSDGSETAARPDALLAVDLVSGQATEVFRGETLPFELGEVRCTTPLSVAAEVGSEECGACFVADAERARLHRLRLTDGALELDASLTVDTSIGLPPRGIGRF